MQESQRAATFASLGLLCLEENVCGKDGALGLTLRKTCGLILSVERVRPAVELPKLLGIVVHMNRCLLKCRNKQRSVENRLSNVPPEK